MKNIYFLPKNKKQWFQLYLVVMFNGCLVAIHLNPFMWQWWVFIILFCLYGIISYGEGYEKGLMNKLFDKLFSGIEKKSNSK